MAVWHEYIKANKGASGFRNKGWEHYELMQELVPNRAWGKFRFHAQPLTDNSPGLSNQVHCYMDFRDTPHIENSSPPPTIESSHPSRNPSVLSATKRKRSAMSSLIDSPSSSMFPSDSTSNKHGHVTNNNVFNDILGELKDFCATLQTRYTYPATLSHQDTLAIGLGPAIACQCAAQAHMHDVEAYLSTNHKITLMAMFHEDVRLAAKYLGIHDDDLRCRWVQVTLQQNQSDDSHFS